MSENWNKKHLHTRLDSIFSDLDDQNHLPGLSIFDQQDGWIWEIDPQGLFVECSPDVEEFLGYESGTLLGQDLASISDFNLSEAELPSEPTTNNPRVIEVVFFRVDGSKQKSTCHFLPLHQAGEFKGWSGITIITEKSSQPLTVSIDDEELFAHDFALPLADLVPPKPTAVVESSPSASNSEPNMDTLEDVFEPVEDGDTDLSYEEIYVTAAYQPDEKIRAFLQSIDDSPNREWEPGEIQLVEQVHNQLELALENANLFQQTQLALAETDEQARRLRLLNELSEKLSQAASMQEIYDHTAEASLEIFSANSTSIVIREEEFLRVVAASGANVQIASGEKLPMAAAPQYKAIAELRVLVQSELNIPEMPDMKSMIAGALASEGKMIGAINVGSDVSGKFDEEDRAFMSQLISIVNASAENRALLDRVQAALSSTEEQARRLAVLNQLSERLGQSGQLEEVITITMEMMDSIIPCKVCSTAIYNPELDAYLIYNLEGEKVTQAAHLLEPENTLVGQIAAEKRLLSDFNLAESTLLDARSWVEEHKINTYIGAPLMSGEKVIGTIMVGNQEEFIYSLQDEALLLSISSLLASTLDNRQLFQQIQRRSIQLETSAEVSRIASTLLDPNELLPEVVERIKTGFDLYYAGIFLIDHDGRLTGEANKWAVLRAGSGEAGKTMIDQQHKLELGGDSMISTAIQKAEARIALNVGEQEIHFRNPALPDTRSEMALPLISRGQPLGAISIQSDKESAFTTEDITSLQTMADQLANAIENARLFEQTEARSRELMVLNEMARAYTQTMDVEALFTHTFTYTNQLLDAENFYLALFDQQENAINIRLLVEDSQRVASPEPKKALGTGLTDWIITNQSPILIAKDVEQEMGAMGIEFAGRSSKSYLGVPMLIGKEVIGVIALQSYTKPNNYTNRDLDLLSAIASQAAVAIDNALRFQQTQARAQFEAVMREITTQVHSTTNPDLILRTAVREVSQALGRQAFIELSPDEKKINTGELRLGDESQYPDARASKKRD